MSDQHPEAAYRAPRDAGCKHGYREDATYWHAWQEGRAWAKLHDFYGAPRWATDARMRGFVMGNAVAAPLLVVGWAVFHALA